MRLRWAKQRGDTIVEVMLAMAVVGMVLGVAYGITNRSVQVGRSAQERSEALKIAETQIELLKEYARSEDRPAGQGVMEKLIDDLTLGPPASIDSACFAVESDGSIAIKKVADALNTEGDDCEVNGLYQVSTVCISGVPNDNASLVAQAQTCTSASSAEDRKILVRVVWERLGGGLRTDDSGNPVPARDKLDLYYRFGG